MNKGKFNIIGIWFLITLLLFAVTPKDILHEFHHHENEIEHVDLDCHNQHFEIKHTHCPVLEQAAPVFNVIACTAYIPIAQSLITFKLKLKVFVKTPTHFLFSLKAPPYCW
ncbi:MAG TPA: hypothetical protein PK323_10545 [Bacteroidia bacterium]|nr:hypothetical protein [Bacteroidia bacterium]